MRFTERTRWSRTENALSKALAAARQRFGDRLIDLTVSNPTAVGLTYPKEAIRAALAGEEAVGYTPHPLGAPGAREAVARYYARRGIEVRPERVALVASTSEAYSFLFRLLGEPGDRVLVPSPSYPLFDFLTALSDLEIGRYRLRYDGSWYLDTDSVTTAIGDDGRAKAVLVVSPNNPTGTSLAPDERRHLAREARDRALAIVSDEVFADFVRSPAGPAAGHRAASWIQPDGDALVFSLNGLSKAAGLPGLKLAWIVVSGPEDAAAEALARLEIVGDTFLSVSTPVQIALPALLELAEPWQDHMRERLDRNRAALERLTAGTAVRVKRSDGGWYSMLEIPRTDTDEGWAIRLVEEAGVLAHPGYLFELEGDGVLVVSLLPEPARFTEGVEKLLDRVR